MHGQKGETPSGTVMVIDYQVVSWKAVTNELPGTKSGHEEPLHLMCQRFTRR
jgi:ABC-type Fe2+-enterobactin transport system substrate-binding protein